MPPILRRNRSIARRNGHVVRTADPAGCPCCGGGGGGPCCPSPCGQKFVVCVTEYRVTRHDEYSGTYKRIDFTIGQPSNCPVVHGPFSWAYSTSRTIDLVGGPTLLPPFDQSPTSTFCCASGQFLVRDVQRRNAGTGFPGVCSLPPVELPATYAEETYCVGMKVGCPPTIAGTGTVPLFVQPYDGEGCPPIEPGRVPLHIVPNNGIFGNTIPTPGGADGAFSDSASTPNPPGFPACVPENSYLETVTVNRSWSFGVGTNTVTSTQTRVRNISGWQSGSDGRCVFENDRHSETIITTLTYTITPILECDGGTNPPCSGTIQTACTGPIEYIIGEPCPGTTPPRVLFYRAAVTGCDTVNIGGFCYRVSTEGPRTYNPLPTDIITDMVVTNRRRDCCSCLPQCAANRATLTAFPCWQNATRTTAGDLIVTPSNITEDECCCNPNDVFRLLRMEYICEWNGPSGTLSDGAKQTLTWVGFPDIRRNQGGIVNYTGRVRYVPFPGAPECPVNQFPPGCSYTIDNQRILDLTNPPPCGWNDWVQLMSFQRPWEGEPLAQSNCVNIGDLPCVVDANTDGVLGQWQIERLSYVVSCNIFDFIGEWFRPAAGPGGLARVTVRVGWSVISGSIAGEVCSGGCPPPPVFPPINPGPGGGSSPAPGVPLLPFDPNNPAIPDFPFPRESNPVDPEDPFPVGGGGPGPGCSSCGRGGGL